MVRVGKRVKNFTLPATGDQNLSLSDFSGRSLIIYFYPKDNTPGCTREGQDFRAFYPQFEEAGADRFILSVADVLLANHSVENVEALVRAGHDHKF